MPHGDETRNVAIDIDNHGDWLSKDFGGLSLAYLKKLKRFHDALPRSKPWLWCVTSKSWGINILLDIGRPRSSAGVHQHYKGLLKRRGLEAEVYPWGGHNHRLPFGRDYIVLAEDGPITGAAEMIEFYLSPRISASWEAIFDGLLTSWLLGVERHPGRRNEVKARLDEINEWELEGFPLDQVGGIPSSRTTSPSSPGPSSVPSVGWEEYKERFGRSQGSWVRMISDLARNGVPIQDDLYRPLTELAKWLLHVEFYDMEPELRLSRTTDLLMGWLSSKDNGNVSRIQNGRLSDLAGQVERIVARAFASEDFLSAFANMRTKQSSGKYTEVIEIAPLLAGFHAEATGGAPEPHYIEKLVRTDNASLSPEGISSDTASAS